MGKIKNMFNNMSLKTSFIIYTFVFLMIAFLFSLTSSGLCQYWQSSIINKYKEQFEDEIRVEGQIVVQGNPKFNDKVYFYTDNLHSFFSSQDEFIYNLLSFFNFFLVPIWFLICIITAGILFYKRKLKKPLGILDLAAAKIANNNLDFTVEYSKNDEMGKLCSTFEKMRLALKENNLEMWRQMDERKRLNAAFSHDLRTPLTVLKGQSDMLLKYVPDGEMTTKKIVSILHTMKTHITRLETFVDTMSNLQKLEDIDIQKTAITANDLISRLKESGEILRADKCLKFNDQSLTTAALKVDISVVMQVYENILSNAVRYAKNKISIELSSNEAFSITVSDDGNGFSKKDLNNATKPFYQSETNANTSHFGMGLNICKILCEKHGGYMKLSNNSNGATVKAVF
ncbi:ATP-binding protein [Cytobacillus solani]|uniref:HAMP domain-containing sensor histidine kinase n=1 Tax=Cytobacillus solani TaxID=1637975 RepID=UPI0006ABD353|nr:HAMP domain-containing sensor histidine kinase [Cytobacillus solani]